MQIKINLKKNNNLDFPGSTVDGNLPTDAGDIGSIARPRRSHMSQGN